MNRLRIVLATVVACVAIGIASVAAYANVTGIDPAPPDGSGGFYDSSGQPTTTVQPGDTVTLVVTALQDSNQVADGHIHLTWHAGNFVYVGNGDKSATCTSKVNSVDCDYTDFAHSAKSDSFTFTVGASVSGRLAMDAEATAGGTKASRTFYVEVAVAPTPTPTVEPTATPTTQPSATPTPGGESGGSTPTPAPAGGVPGLPETGFAPVHR
jgi:hypothetical protein